MMKLNLGQLILFGTLLFLVTSRPAVPEPPYEMSVDRNALKILGTLIRIAGEEMVAIADSENIEEHIIVKSERIFDDFANEADFPGPDRITKPLARRMVRPLVKAIIRYVDKKGEELSIQEEENLYE